MARLHVETWAPDYGSSLDLDEALADETKVDETVELAERWEPVEGIDDGVDEVCFVDGVRRVDARLAIEDDAGPVPGIAGSYGVGCVVWNRVDSASEITVTRIQRLAVFSAGRGAVIPPLGPDLQYRAESVPDHDPASLVRRFHGAMRSAEAELGEELARAGRFVVADGPINDLSATEKVGYVKSHRVPYLSTDRSSVIGHLVPGQRTPLFLIGQGGPYERYSWYMRLAEIAGGHSWTGVVRGELSAALPLTRARAVAGRAAALLPDVASRPHTDPRAPQNLVPIAALERDLRRRLGDQGIVYRRLRSAVMTEIVGTT